jgi:phosphohistidine phosphatase
MKAENAASSKGRRMEKLYVMRHGIAVEPGTAGYPDDARPLTSDGEERVGEIAKGLKRVKIGLDRIVTSPLPRAQRTAEIVAKVLGLDNLVETCDALRAGVGARSIRDWLQTREERRLMIVGHNPDFTDLVGLLIGLRENQVRFELKKGGMAAFRVSERATYELKWLATPGLLRM